jgi:alkylhydroperoxidase family enzyme
VSTRIPLLDTEAAIEAASEVGVPKMLAKLSIFRSVLHQKKYSKALSDLLMCLLSGENLPHRLRELIIMRIGWTTGSVYEWAEHWRIAQFIFEVPQDDLLAVRDWEGYPGFDERDRAVLKAVDDTVRLGTISQQVWGELAALFDEVTLVELVGAIGTWSMVSFILRTLEVPLDDGDSPWPPDGVGPQ